MYRAMSSPLSPIRIMPFALLALVIFVALPTQLLGQTTPDQVALDYIKLISKGSIDINKHTAISENCSLSRKEEIIEKLASITENNFQEGDTFSIESEKRIENLAAVLILKKNTLNPLNFQIFPVALIKKEQQWLPAPVVGSFTNSGYGYDIEIENNTKSLESWMAQQKKLEEQYKRSAHEQLITSIKQADTSSPLEKINKQQMFEQFTKHCKSNDVINILASLGASVENSPEPIEDLEGLLQNVTLGLNTPQTNNNNNPWEKLTSPHYLAQVLETNNANGNISVGFYNLLKNSDISFQKFNSFRHQEKTYLVLSEELKYSMIGSNQRNRTSYFPFKKKQEFTEKIIPAILNKYPPTTYNTPEELQKKIANAVKSNSFPSLVPLLPRDGEFYELSKNQNSAFKNLNTLWKQIFSIDSKLIAASPILKSETLALIPVFVSKNSSLNDLTATYDIWLSKGKKSWHIVDTTTLKKNATPELSATIKQLEKQLSDYLEKSSTERKNKTLNQITSITLPLKNGLSSEEEALKTLDAFRAALRASDIYQAFAYSAFINASEDNNILDIFQYELKGALDHIPYDHYLGTLSSGNWQGVSLRTESKTTAVKDYPLYIVINTDQGAKILRGVDLRYANNKGRKMLNTKLWKKLEAEIPAQSIDHIRTLFKKHQELVEQDIIELNEMME